MKYKLFIVFSIFLLLSAFLPAMGQQNDNAPSPQNAEYANGIVLKIISQSQNNALQETLGGSQITQLVQVKILDGKYRGKVIKIENQLTSNPAYDIKIKPGSRVVLDIEKIAGKTEFNISDNDRSPALMIIVGLFLALLLIIGGMKGFRSLISLLITSFLVFFILVPSILKGYPIIPVTVIIAIISTVAAMLVIGGANAKSLSASIGTIGGVLAAGLISMIVIKIAPLSGFHSHETIMLYTSRPYLNFTGLLSAGMIIGALGAIMDVGISIASSVAEVKSINNNLTVMQLMESGLNVGKDIMGAMSNTLILAYIGAALPLILLATEAPLLKLINLNSIMTEITAAIAGSIGIILCVPVTAFVSAYLTGNKSGKENLSNQKQ